MAKASPAASPDRNWEAEADLRTLCEAEEIKKDSKRMGACKKMAKEKMKAMGAVAEKK